MGESPYSENLPNTQQARQQYGELFRNVSALLFELDPIGINFETNTDEYDPEAGTIIPRLPDCSCPEEVQDIVHEEFVRWFEADTAGPRSRYREAAERIWMLWNRHNTLE